MKVVTAISWHLNDHRPAVQDQSRSGWMTELVELKIHLSGKKYELKNGKKQA